MRTIRYYVQQRVIDAPEREARDALYRRRHLVQTLAARVLAAQGWPLAKIAELTQTTPTDELDKLLPDRGGRARTRAQDLVEHFASRAETREPSVKLYRKLASPSPPTEGLEPRRRLVTRITVAPGLVVEIDPMRLRAMPKDAIDALGDAVKSALARELKKGDPRL